MKKILLSDIIKPCIHEKKVYIWGAWERGRILNDILSEQGIEVHGFIDSGKVGIFHSKQIYHFNDLKNQPDIFILLSIIEHKEVRKILEENSFVEFENYLYLGSDVCLNGNSRVYLDVFENYVYSNSDIENAEIKLSIGSTIKIGKNVSIGNNVIFVARGRSTIEIGDNVKMDSNVSIICEDGSKLKIGDNVGIDNSVSLKCMDNSKLEIGDNAKIGKRSTINCREYSNFNCGDKTTMARVVIVASFHSSFVCGTDCMFSYEIYARTHDGHTIIDEDNLPSKKTGILFGDHIWCGMNVNILPGTVVGKNCIIGAGTLVNKKVEDGSMVVGVPCKVIKKGVNWDRQLVDIT